jgi:hypothetical protein
VDTLICVCTRKATGLTEDNQLRAFFPILCCCCLLPSAVVSQRLKKKPFDGKKKKTSSDVDTLICTAPPPASLLLLPSAVVPLLCFRCGSWEIRHLLCAENTGFKKHLHGWIMWGEGGWSDRTAKVYAEVFKNSDFGWVQI